MMVKRSMPAPTAIDTFLGDVLSSGFYVTSNDDEIGYRIQTDGADRKFRLCVK